LEKAANNCVPVVAGDGCWSPMFFNRLPCKRLSRAFWTVGSFKRGEGETPVEEVVVDDVTVLDAIDKHNTINIYEVYYLLFIIYKVSRTYVRKL